jgi:hypothetical protein
MWALTAYGSKFRVAHERIDPRISPATVVFSRIGTSYRGPDELMCLGVAKLRRTVLVNNRKVWKNAPPYFTDGPGLAVVGKRRSRSRRRTPEAPPLAVALPGRKGGS